MDEINVDRELQLNQFIKELDLENNEAFQQFSGGGQGYDRGLDRFGQFYRSITKKIMLLY